MATSTKPTIGIIGSGNIGGALAHRFNDAGYAVAIANSRGPASLEALASETGATPATVERVARENDVVVVTIPMGKIPSLPKRLFDGASDRLVVVDTCNYYPRERDGKIAAIESAPSESSWVQGQIGRPVVKVFNTIMAEHLLHGGKAAGASDRIALAVAGDDAEAKHIVMDLVDAIGFDPVDAGSIAESWRQQPGSPGYIEDYDAAGVRRALAEATPERTPQWTGTERSPGSYDRPA